MAEPNRPPPRSAAQCPGGTPHRRPRMVFVDVSEGASTLIREEFELAKAEVTEKVGKLVRGSVVGVAAGIFAFLALILVMEGIAWLLKPKRS